MHAVILYHTKACLSVQWFSTYSRLLSNYMRRDKGIGMDLTLVSILVYIRLCWHKAEPILKPSSGADW